MRGRQGGLRIDIESEVITKDGHHVGKIDRVVMVPRSLEVTHIVIHKGRVLTRDIVVPVEAIDRTTKRHVILGVTVAEIESMPDFSEEEYMAPPQAAPIGPYVPGSVLWPLAYVYAPVIMHEERHIPEEAVDITEGTDVRCVDGKIGIVDEVVVDSETGRVTAFIVRKGTLLTKDVTVPVTWIKSADRDAIELACSRQEVEQSESRYNNR
ncbi:MAG: PRC-barrel domain-containing protein [Chloroflexi bacterium]|nr:PRC-barrel domain-containing protein [Chloroflexota bacterium]